MVEQTPLASHTHVSQADLGAQTPRPQAQGKTPALAVAEKVAGWTGTAHGTSSGHSPGDGHGTGGGEGSREEERRAPGPVFLRVRQGLLLEVDMQHGRVRRRVELDSLQHITS